MIIRYLEEMNIKSLKYLYLKFKSIFSYAIKHIFESIFYKNAHGLH